MREAAGLRGISKYLLTNGVGLITRNAWGAEINQASRQLSHGVLAGVPRPVERGQGDGQDPCGEEVQQQVSNTHHQWPTPDPLPRAALIMAQAQFFDLVEVDFDLEAASLGMNHVHRSKGEVGREQIPRGEGQSGDGDDHYARGQRALGPNPAQEDGSLPDHDSAGTTPYAQDGLVLTQARRKASERRIDTAGLAKQAGATPARRALTWAKVDALITAQSGLGPRGCAAVDD
jgi:hypothetical protein